MLAQPVRELRPVAEEAGENAAIRGNDRVARVEHVERRGAVVSVDDGLDAVSHVVDSVAKHAVVARVRVGIGRRERVDDPDEPALLRDDNVWIGIER